MFLSFFSIVFLENLLICIVAKNYFYKQGYALYLKENFGIATFMSCKKLPSRQSLSAVAWLELGISEWESI